MLHKNNRIKKNKFFCLVLKKNDHKIDMTLCFLVNVLPIKQWKKITIYK